MNIYKLIRAFKFEEYLNMLFLFDYRYHFFIKTDCPEVYDKMCIIT